MIVNVTPATPSGVSVSTAGPRGPAATIEIGSVNTVAHDAPAAVENVGTETQAVFDIDIPAGPPPIITIDTVTTGLPGSSVVVNLTETAPGQYELDFAIPRGDAGASAYLYIAYASDSIGTGFTTTFDPDLDWVAFKRTTSPIAVPAAADFVGLWKNTRGPIGETPEVAFEIGTVTTGLPGTSASVDINEVSPGQYEIDFTIPQGDPGDLGDAMMKTDYDPNGIESDAFSMGNMVETAGAKIMTAAERTKLAGVATGATANSSDTTLLARENHTGSQAISTVSGLQAALDALSGRTTGFVAASPITASGAAVVITDLDCDDIIVFFNGVSHNNGANTALNAYYSTNNGGSWSSAMSLSASVAASATLGGAFAMRGLREGNAVADKYNLLLSGSFPGIVLQSTTPTLVSIIAGGQINALKFEWAAGAFDAGTVQYGARG